MPNGAALFLSGSEKSQVKLLWAVGGSESGLNPRFLKRGKPRVDTKTSSSERRINHGPNHSANSLGFKRAFHSMISWINPIFCDIAGNLACKSHKKRTFHEYHKTLSNGGEFIYLFIYLLLKSSGNPLAVIRN
jgi:hypothetical protein